MVPHTRFRRYKLADLAPPDMHDRMRASCDLCAHDGTFTLLASETAEDDGLRALVGPHAQTVTVMCPNCGWTFKPGRLTGAQVAALYSRAGGSATVNPAVLKSADDRSENVRAYVERAAGHEIVNASVLDVGGGAGQASIAFTKSKCHVDLLEVGGGAPIDQSMKVIRSSFDDFQTASQYDLVILSHVLEHTWEPLQWLVRARQLLLPSGLVFVEVPFEFYTPYLKGKLGDPCHAGYFSARTLPRFLEKAGFAVVALDRTLAPYDSRRVMAIRAVGIAGSGERRPTKSEQVKIALLRNVLEMIHPQQLLQVLLRR